MSTLGTFRCEAIVPVVAAGPPLCGERGAEPCTFAFWGRRAGETCGKPVCPDHGTMGPHGRLCRAHAGKTAQTLRMQRGGLGV